MKLGQRGRARVAPRCWEPGRQAMCDELHLLANATAFNPQRHMAFIIRHPLMYRPLVEFMFHAPWEQKLRPGCDRFLQRRALKGILPEKVRRRAGKAGATASLVEGLRRSRHWIDFLCDDPMIAREGIADATAWRRAVRQASVGHTQDDKHFMAAIAVEVWLKQLADHRRELRDDSSRVAAGQDLAA